MNKCNACIIYDEVSNALNHLVISGERIYRLLGVSKDDQDWYYILETLHGKQEYHSCVGDFDDLYPLMNRERYDRLDGQFTMNQPHHREQKYIMVNVLDTLKESCYCNSMEENNEV